MGRRGRAALLAVAGFLLATPLPPGAPLPPPGLISTAFVAEPVLLDPDDPARRQVGRLRFLAGWSLRSGVQWFGGISGMHVGPEQIVAISDAGALFRFDRPDRGGRRLTIVPLVHGPGAVDDKMARDAEALAVHGGSAWISFENRNQIWRYRLEDLTAAARSSPREIRRWPANRGGEALARLADGRFLLLSEHQGRSEPISPALLFLGDPALPATRVVPLRYRPPRGYRITDAALLPDGRLLLLSRSFALFDGLFSARLAIADVPTLADEVIEGEEIAAIGPPLTRDNFEALGVTQEDGRTIIWLASDDNFMPFERTLLMKFELILP